MNDTYTYVGWFYGSVRERQWDEREVGLSVEEFTKYLRINNAHHEQSLKDTNSMPQKKRIQML